ncbi:hypothetical protein [Pseudonocardia sp. WMMC193]|uniref:hypothetical protein n=1 Tax=Pseudonocardia sp. WMMC193 TaxID=2911965 RepID=UPI001F47994D|nr:hypothetical protein [Pseudonocardia sp. WMMC193]MCF7548901.1 hypothetical protein [Pseudonocardia sp. WMMC193]
MARTSVTTQVVTRAGLAPSFTAPVADGDIIDPGRVVLHVKTAGSPVTVTVVTPSTQSGLAVEDLTVTVPASSEREIGPFPKSTFAQPSDAAVGPTRVLVDYSTVTGVTRAVKGL